MQAYNQSGTRVCTILYTMLANTLCTILCMHSMAKNNPSAEYSALCNGKYIEQYSAQCSVDFSDCLIFAYQPSNTLTFGDTTKDCLGCLKTELSILHSVVDSYAYGEYWIAQDLYQLMSLTIQ